MRRALHDAGSAAARRRGDLTVRRAAGIAAAAIAVAAVIWISHGSDHARSVASAPPATGGTGVSGIAQLPGERFVILFQAGKGGEARVELSDDPEVQVRAPAGAATFASKSDYLLIGSKDSSAVFKIRIPRSAPWLEIRTEEEPIFLKDGPRITTAAPRDASGYVLTLPR